jgi:hypothetical protein
MTIPATISPLPFHRNRRDHQLRLLFSAAQRQVSGKPAWIRAAGNARAEILSLVEEAIYHADETLRLRSLEWPDSRADQSDSQLRDFLVEIRDWFRILEHSVPGGDDPRAGIQPLLEARMRLGQQLFHSSRHPMPAHAQPH